jgi:glutathione S-transferase
MDNSVLDDPGVIREAVSEGMDHLRDMVRGDRSSVALGQSANRMARTGRCILWRRVPFEPQPVGTSPSPSGEFPMLTIHHLGISQSDRIVWLCEELGISNELKRYERDPATRLAPAQYRALHPLGTAPIITDGDVTLGESGAIIEYIIHRYGEGRLAVVPSDATYPEYLFWFHFANGSLMPAAMVGLVYDMLGGVESEVSKSLVGRLDRCWDMIETRLGQSPYLAGNQFTAADIINFFPLTTMRLFAPRDITPYPNIRAYLTRIGARPAFQRAMSKADPGFAVPLA